MICLTCSGTGTEYTESGFPRICSCQTTSATKSAIETASAVYDGPVRLTESQVISVQDALGFTDEGLSSLLAVLPDLHPATARLHAAKDAVLELYREVKADAR